MMRPASGHIAAGIAVAWLAGCATAPREEATFVAPGISFRTPSPAELGYSVRVAQLITARYGDEAYVFEAELSVSPESLTLICIDSFGRRALTIVWQGGRITTDAASWLPTALRAQNILADIALVYWPDAAVRRGFDETAVTVSREGQRRAIAVEGKDVISISYGPVEDGRWPSMARYSNKGFGYELVLRSAVMSP
jgi:hypothetical protein